MTAIGIGSSVMVISYDDSSYKNEENMISANFRVGVDYAISKNIILSGEGIFHGMTNRDFGGAGRSNSMFHLKLGAGYMFTQIGM